jgi:hypothetical protein
MNGKAHGLIVIDQVQPATPVKIFTVSGHWVTTLNTDAQGKTAWDPSGVASGIYLYLTKDIRGNTSKGKLAVIK